MKTVISLNGIWNFLADLDPKYHCSLVNHSYTMPETNRRHWLKVPVPGVWQKYGERYDIYEGVCWFHRTFTLEKMAEDAVVKLCFGAVNYQCDVFINGQALGSHETGYTRFSFDISKYLQAGENHLAVRVDNRATSTKWPPCFGYFNYGGIHREVTLEIMQGPSLDDIQVKAVYNKNGKGKLCLSGRVVNHKGKKLKVAAAINGQTREIPVADGSFDLGDWQLDDISPWSPESPQLNGLELSLKSGKTLLDTEVFKIGFKKVEVKKQRIHLNSRIYPLKGICYVYDSPVHGLVMTPEDLENDISLMKELGCNAVRCHYPMDELFYSLCDQYGLLVWIEPTVYCYHPADDAKNTYFGDPACVKLACNMISEMISTAVNHPSVAIYGIGNECNTRNPEAEPFFRKLAETIRKTDVTRLCSYAALYGNVGSLADIVDVLGVNSYWGWYDKIGGGKGLAPDEDWSAHKNKTLKPEPIDLISMRGMLDKILEKKQNLALLLTEFGADSVPGNYSRTCDLWSENYHAALLQEIFLLAQDYPQIAGTFPFCFGDYRDPSKYHNGYWNELNLKGVVDYRRHKKMAFNALKKIYTE
jgi:beta-glucuronidase